MKKTTRADRETEFRRRCLHEPAFFAKKALRITLDEYAAEALDYLAANAMGKVVARLPRGAGKTYGIGAIAVAWFMACFSPCRVVTTAPTFYQVENLLWRDINTIGKDSKVSCGPGLLRTRWELPGNRFASGISTDIPARIEGPHADNVLVIIDEAKGVAKWAWDSLEGSFSTCKRANELAISTPWEKTSELYRADVGQRGKWHTIHRTAQQCPRISDEWIAGRFDEWGEESPLYQAQVLANYVDIAENALVPLDWLERARYREPMEEESNASIGLDIQRGGPDANVITVRRGGRVTMMVESRSKDSTKIKHRVASIARQEDAQVVTVDTTGMGGPIADDLREMGINAADFEAGSNAIEDTKFVNTRAEAFWNLHELFRENKIDLSGIPEGMYRHLVSQLTTLDYEYRSDTKGERLAIEQKKHWKTKTARQSSERMSHSPDHADSLAMCFYNEVEGTVQAFDTMAYNEMELVRR